MTDITARQFVRQQGFRDASATSCEHLYPALMFQPRIVAMVIVLGVALQSPGIWLVLAILLWWSALVPTRNPFEAIYNSVAARPRGLPSIEPAPAPRRFAQAMAGTLSAGAALCLLAGSPVAAWVFEGVLVAAVGALVLGRFCLGSYLFHLLRGDVVFANRTLPWSSSE